MRSTARASRPPGQVPARPLNLPQQLTAFTCTIDGAGRILMVRHERLGVVRWELPGGHVEPGETAAEAAVRETAEETGVVVTPGRIVADCVHHWRGRSVEIVYFEASPQPPFALGTADARISAVDWIDLPISRPRRPRRSAGPSSNMLLAATTWFCIWAHRTIRRQPAGNP
jgi:ADP-ribose pyrophosphatase YjhB (NUDIX family)